MAFSLKKRSKAGSKETGIAPRKEKTPPKGKVFKAARGTRFVLFIGDEGAILVHLKDNSVISRQFVPDASQHNLDEFKQTFAKDPKAPVTLVVDSMDQSYVQQTLPPVSAMSVGKLIKRRLDRDFGSSDIKGAVVLGREKAGRKDWNFMMIALERSPQLNVWLEFVMELPNRFKGIHLVSVETETLLKSLERAIGVPKEGTGSEWKFFVSHNKVGGFRQVILRNNRIIFTRLAQPLGEANTEVIAGSIEQEMLSTIEYMKRLSYNPASGLDIYIVASSGIKEAIDSKKFNATSTQIFTPFEIAQFFGIEGATQPTDQFGDVVLAAIIGSMRKYVLTLSVPQYKKLDTTYKLIMGQRLMAGVSIVALIAYTGYMAFDIMSLSSQAEELEKKKASEQNTLTALRAEITRTNLDVEKATDLIDLYKQLKKENVTPLYFMERLRPLITSPISLKSIEWAVVDNKAGAGAPVGGPPPMDPTGGTQGAAGGPTGGKQFVATLIIELPAVAADRKARKIVMNKVLTDFRTALKGYEVTIEKNPNDIDPSLQQFKVSSNKSQDASPPVIVANSNQLVEEKITIRGPIPTKSELPAENAATPATAGAPATPANPAATSAPAVIPVAPGGAAR